MLSRRRILGLAVEGRSITAVELAALNGGAEACRAAKFTFPDSLNLAEPAKLGKAFRTFLKENRFAASRCVIGLDARSLTARDKTLPPGVGAQAGQVLALAVEREFASDLKDLIVDYAPAGEQNGQAMSALLVAAPRITVEQLTAMAQAAGLRVEGVTSSTLVLAGPGGTPGAMPADNEKLVLRIFGAGAELLTESASGSRTMRPLGAGANLADSDADGLNRLLAELRRVVMLLPPALPPGSRRKMLLWNEAGLDNGVSSAIADHLNVSVKVESVPDGVHTNGLGTGPRPGQFCAASAVALAAVRGQALPVDFLNSRLGAARKSVLNRKTAWAAAAVGVLVVLAGMAGWDWHQDRSEADTLRAHYMTLKPALADADATINRTAMAQTWYDRRPECLACMAELARAFPERGQVWAKMVTVEQESAKKDQPGKQSESHKPARLSVTVSGFGDSTEAILGVRDRLIANPRISELVTKPIRDAGKGGREKSFSLTFTFDGSSTK